MPEQRLKQLMKTEECEYAEGSPLIIEARALYSDSVTGNCIVQIKWRNLDSRTIKAVMIEIDCMDAFGQSLDTTQYQYYDVSANRGDYFGNKTAIPIRMNKMVGYSVRIKAVSFTDGTIWRSETEQIFQPLPESKPQTLSGELLEQFNLDIKKAGYLKNITFCSQEYDGLWQCGCGCWQFSDTACLNCGITREILSGISDVEVLNQHISARKEEEERKRIEIEKERIASEKEALAAQIENSSYEVFRAACFLLDRLIPSYDNALSLLEEAKSSRFGKKTKAANVMLVFLKISDRIEEPMATITDNLPMALQGGNSYPQEVFDLYKLFQKKVMYNLDELNAVVDSNNEWNEKKKKIEIAPINNEYNGLLNTVRSKTDKIR